jgi:hypothetical protein
MVVDGRKYPLRALLDSDAEVNIIRTGIIPHQTLQHDSQPLTLKGADDTCLKGGNLCVIGVSEVVGNDKESQRNVHVQCAIHMYEANITVQAIISYKWLADKISWSTPVVMVSISRMRTYKCSFQELRKRKMNLQPGCTK